MYIKDPACIFTENGWVEIDHVKRKVKRSIPMNHEFEKFRTSQTYKTGVEKKWFPPVSLESSKNKLNWYNVDYINFMTRPHEWSTTQKLDALKFIADLEIFLLENNFFIAFPHLGNVTFNPQPIYMDMGDIRPSSQFQNSQQLLHYFWKDMTGHPELGPYKISDKIKNWSEIKLKLNSLSNTPCNFKELSDRLKKIRKLLDEMIPADKSGAWSNYDGPPLPTSDNVDYVKLRTCQQSKSSVIYDTIKRLKPKTLIDVGAYRGFYSFMAESLGAKVLGLELCEDAVADAYNRSKKFDLDCSFICADLLNLPGAYGKNGAYRSIRDRIKAEGVIVPAVTHHLSRNVGFNYQSDLLSGFAEKWLLVEFIPKTDVHVATWSMPNWYTEDNFKLELNRHWKKITILDSYPSPRKWMLCEK